MEDKNLYKSPINYGNESVTLELYCRNYLFENNFFENSEVQNIELLEQALINYSIIKLAEWSHSFNFEQNFKIEDWNDFPTLLEALNSMIPTKEDKDAFFSQYTHSILNILGQIKKQPQINWYKCNTYSYGYKSIFKNGSIKSIITGSLTPPYTIPIELSKTIKQLYPQKKNPVLQK